LSGSALAASFGLPDVGLVPPDDLVRTTKRIADVADVPLIVDAECGFGGTSELARYARLLREAGATGALIEDQEFTGQSVASAGAGLCEQSTMVERIEVAKDATGGALGVLGRTDVIGSEWPFDETLARLRAYRDAGADWLTAVFLRSESELALAAEVAPRQFVAIAVPGATGYIPDPAAAFSSGAIGVIVTGFLQAAFSELRGLYEVVLSGDTATLRDRQPARDEFAAAMGFANT
jgi:methylisocitrate lyase